MIGERIEGLEWAAVGEDLDRQGWAVLPSLLTAAGEALFGASIGKRLMGLRVVSAEAPEARLPPGRAIARNLLLFGVCRVTALLGPGMPLGALGAAFAPRGLRRSCGFRCCWSPGGSEADAILGPLDGGARGAPRLRGRPPRRYPLPSRWD